jgi:hypothetical protein
MGHVVKNVVIEQTAFNPMQSGRFQAAQWHISFVRDEKAFVDPLMGWIGTQDTCTELKLSFDHIEEAIHYVNEKGWAYRIRENHKTSPFRIKRYGDNFLLPHLR